MTNFNNIFMVYVFLRMLSQMGSSDNVGKGEGGQMSNRGSNMMPLMGMGLLGAGLMPGMRGGSSLLPGLLGSFGNMRGSRGGMMNNMIGTSPGRKGSKNENPLALTSRAPATSSNLSAPAFRLAFALPGRRRYRANLSPQLATVLQDKLSKLDFLASCQINHLSGSLLFQYDASDTNETAMDNLATFLSTRIFGCNEQVC